jgi:2-polyprenyl-6-methoxyphenol hydroxylase-like FAD-dependent oxidoreductase
MPQAAHPREILIVGASLGGLAAGLALQTDGHRVTIIDSAPEFAEVSHRIMPNKRALTFCGPVQAFVFRQTVPAYFSDGESTSKK